jgi:hypothetical protein
VSELALGIAGFVLGLFACWWDRRARNLDRDEDGRGGAT